MEPHSDAAQPPYSDGCVALVLGAPPFSEFCQLDPAIDAKLSGGGGGGDTRGRPPRPLIRGRSNTFYATEESQKLNPHSVEYFQLAPLPLPPRADGQPTDCFHVSPCFLDERAAAAAASTAADLTHARAARRLGGRPHQSDGGSTPSLAHPPRGRARPDSPRNGVAPIAVEPFSRSAAGKGLDPEHLRTPLALEKTMHFLVEYYLRSPHTPHSFTEPSKVWGYLWDRMRHIRTNWVPQLPLVSAGFQNYMDEATGRRLDPDTLSRESRRRMQWLEFTVAALSVGAAYLCRTVDGCRGFLKDKKHFLESISQCFTDLAVWYRAEQRGRHAEFLSLLLLLYGLNQESKVEDRAGFFSFVDVQLSDGTTRRVPEPVSASVNLAQVYQELEKQPHLMDTQPVKAAVTIINTWAAGSWFGFFSACRTERLTPLQRALVFQSFTYARFRCVLDLVLPTNPTYPKLRWRNSIRLDTLTDLLMMQDTSQCVAFLTAMGLGEMVDQQSGELRLSDVQSRPLITAEEIERRCTSRGLLMFPTHVQFFGFRVWQEAFERYPQESFCQGDVQTIQQLRGASERLYQAKLARARCRGGGAAKEACAAAVAKEEASVRELEHRLLLREGCPVNLMEVLEPYCPPYNAEVAGLTMTDVPLADHILFGELPAHREAVLLRMFLRANPSSEAALLLPHAAASLTDSTTSSGGPSPATAMREAVTDMLDAFEEESVATDSDVYDLEGEVAERGLGEGMGDVHYPGSDAAAHRSFHENSGAAEESEEGGDAEAVPASVMAARALLVSLRADNVYDRVEREIADDAERARRAKVELLEQLKELQRQKGPRPPEVEVGAALPPDPRGERQATKESADTPTTGGIVEEPSEGGEGVCADAATAEPTPSGHARDARAHPPALPAMATLQVTPLPSDYTSRPSPASGSTPVVATSATVESPQTTQLPTPLEGPSAFSTTVATVSIEEVQAVSFPPLPRLPKVSLAGAAAHTRADTRVMGEVTSCELRTGAVAETARGGRQGPTEAPSSSPQPQSQSQSQSQQQRPQRELAPLARTTPTPTPTPAEDKEDSLDASLSLTLPGEQEQSGRADPHGAERSPAIDFSHLRPTRPGTSVAAARAEHADVTPACTDALRFTARRSTVRRDFLARPSLVPSVLARAAARPKSVAGETEGDEEASRFFSGGFASLVADYIGVAVQTICGRPQARRSLRYALMCARMEPAALARWRRALLAEATISSGEMVGDMTAGAGTNRTAPLFSRCTAGSEGSRSGRALHHPCDAALRTLPSEDVMARRVCVGFALSSASCARTQGEEKDDRVHPALYAEGSLRDDGRGPAGKRVRRERCATHGHGSHHHGDRLRVSSRRVQSLLPPAAWSDVARTLPHAAASMPGADPSMLLQLLDNTLLSEELHGDKGASWVPSVMEAVQVFGHGMHRQLQAGGAAKRARDDVDSHGFSGGAAMEASATERMGGEEGEGMTYHARFALVSTDAAPGVADSASSSGAMPDDAQGRVWLARQLRDGGERAVAVALAGHHRECPTCSHDNVDLPGLPPMRLLASATTSRQVLTVCAPNSSAGVRGGAFPSQLVAATVEARVSAYVTEATSLTTAAATATATTSVGPRQSHREGSGGGGGGVHVADAALRTPAASHAGAELTPQVTYIVYLDTGSRVGGGERRVTSTTTTTTAATVQCSSTKPHADSSASSSTSEGDAAFFTPSGWVRGLGAVSAVTRCAATAAWAAARQPVSATTGAAPAQIPGLLVLVSGVGEERGHGGSGESGQHAEGGDERAPALSVFEQVRERVLATVATSWRRQTEWLERNSEQQQQQQQERGGEAAGTSPTPSSSSLLSWRKSASAKGSVASDGPWALRNLRGQRRPPTPTTPCAPAGTPAAGRVGCSFAVEVIRVREVGSVEGGSPSTPALQRALMKGTRALLQAYERRVRAEVSGGSLGAGDEGGDSTAEWWVEGAAADASGRSGSGGVAAAYPLPLSPPGVSHGFDSTHW